MKSQHQWTLRHTAADLSVQRENRKVVLLAYTCFSQDILYQSHYFEHKPAFMCQYLTRRRNRNPMQRKKNSNSVMTMLKTWDPHLVLKHHYYSSFTRKKWSFIHHCFGFLCCCFLFVTSENSNSSVFYQSWGESGVWVSASQLEQQRLL